MPDLNCPCGSGRLLTACCGSLHGGTPASDAEALMRSRYSAYLLGQADYLLASWRPSIRPEADGPMLDPAIPVKWLRLKILDDMEEDADHAIVEFKCRIIEGGFHRRYRERSRFVREDGR